MSVSTSYVQGALLFPLPNLTPFFLLWSSRRVVSVDSVFCMEVIADVVCPAQSQWTEEKSAKREEYASVG